MFARALPALLFALAPVGVQAAPTAPGKNAAATVQVSNPASVRKLQDLNFAFLGVTTAGTAVIDPNSDSMTTTGGVLHIARTPYAAQFEAVSPVKGVVIVRAPKDPSVLTRVGGTETMTVSNWTISGSGRRNVSAKEPFSFKVGGTLSVGANQVEGLYTGTFDVEVQYP